jgi:hypothetical protein
LFVAAIQLLTTFTPPVAALGGKALDPALVFNWTSPDELQLEVQTTGEVFAKYMSTGLLA